MPSRQSGWEWNPIDVQCPEEDAEMCWVHRSGSEMPSRGLSRFDCLHFDVESDIPPTVSIPEYRRSRMILRRTRIRWSLWRLRRRQACPSTNK